MKAHDAVMRSAQRNAFTLIEILVVIAVLGIAGAMVIPFMGGITEFHTEAAARRIVNDLTFAQSDAMARQEGRRVLFSDDGGGYRLLVPPYDPLNDILYDPTADNADGQFIVDFANDDRFQQIHIDLVAIDGASRFITYDALGGPIAPDGTVSAGGRIELTGPDGRFEILIGSFTGRTAVNRLE